MNKQPAIEFKNITKTFGKVVANKNVNLSANRGEILSILGENGSGKTTLMNMVSGIYYPVFIESIDNGYINKLDITTTMNTVTLNIDSTSDEFNVQIFDNNELIINETFTTKTRTFNIDNPKCWEPNNPHLYDLIITTKTDKITSIAYVIAILGLAGFPVTSGFVAKIYLFSAIAHSGLIFIPFLLVLLILTVVALFYYLKLIRPLFEIEKISGKLNYGYRLLNLLILVVLI